MKAKPSKTRRAPAERATKGKKPVRLLAGDNPQIPKGDGDASVKAYIAAVPGWKREVARKLDDLIVRTVPNVKKAVKWNSPLYGLEGKGFFLSVHMYARYVKVAFFRGTSLKPLPPGESKTPDTRYVDIHEDSAPSDAQLAKWVKQAAKLPGWVP